MARTLALWLLPALAYGSNSSNSSIQGLPEQYLGRPAYFGLGWEDPVNKQVVYAAVPVQVDAVSALTIASTDLDDNFDWLQFEAGGEDDGFATGPLPFSRVKPIEGFEAQPLQSWEPRYDAVQHGYFMLYQFDDQVSALELPMEEYFFSISFDTHVHPDYDSKLHGEIIDTSNSSVRFTLYEELPMDLGDISNPDADPLPMVNELAASTVTLTGGNAHDVFTRRHRLMWGFGNGGHGVLNANCTKPVQQLFIGVQCLQGFAFPTGACTPNVMAAPTLDDCVSYCPFTLTVRAIPRVLRHGDAVPTIIGPGQWLAFELDVGPYDLVEVTIDRTDYNNETHPFAWADGFSGGAWLSRGQCVHDANVTEHDAHGFCPHGGDFIVTTSQQEVRPHHQCGRGRNYSNDVWFEPAEGPGGADEKYVREARVTPATGEVDDLGYGIELERIRRERAALEQSMHYPTQLQIRARIAALEAAAANLSKANADWRRRFPMRICTSAAEAGRYFVTLWGQPSMDVTAHSGLFLVRMRNERFERAPLTHDVPRRGCLKKGGEEAFVLATSAAAPELTSLGLAEVLPYHVLEGSNYVSTLTVRRGAPPTPKVYDARVSHPQLRVGMSACDALAPQQWHLSVSLAADAVHTEAFFELRATLEDASRTLGEALSGFTCCSQYKYYAFPSVSEAVAPSVRFNLTSGRIKALYWRYDACPRETDHVVDGQCLGWCVLEWYRLFSGSLGVPRYLSASTLGVPFGLGELPDKRRGGRWYLGIQALEGPAEYTALTAEDGPAAVVDDGCSRLDRYCPTSDRYKQLDVSAASRADRTVGLWAALLGGGALILVRRRPAPGPAMPSSRACAAREWSRTSS